MLPCLTPCAEGTILAVQVQPRSSRNLLVGLQGELLKLKLTSPPVEGAANAQCCAFLAELFGIARGRVELLAGQRSRQKRYLLQGVPHRQAELHLSQMLMGSGSNS